MNRLFRLAATAAAYAGVSLLAHADTILNFSGSLDTDRYSDTSGDYDHVRPLTGTLTVAADGVTVTAISLTAQVDLAKQADVTNGTVVFKDISSQSVANGMDMLRIEARNGPISADLVLAIPVTSLAGPGGPVCTIGTDCLSYGDLYDVAFPTEAQMYDLTLPTGTLTNPDYVPPLPTSATPEPGSMALVATGLLGVAGIIRRKI